MKNNLKFIFHKKENNNNQSTEITNILMRSKIFFNKHLVTQVFN
jgi:hypothetical protein